MSVAKHIKSYFKLLFSGKNKNISMNKRQESHLCFMLKYKINVKEYIHLFSEMHETVLQKTGNKGKYFN